MEPAPPPPGSADLLAEVEFTRALLDSLREGIVACDAAGILRLFNAATRTFHGVDEEALGPDEWAGRYDLFEADGTTPMTPERIPLFRALAGENVRDAEMVIAPKDGARRTLLASGQSFYGDDGEKLGAVVAMHDVTERRAAEEGLRLARDEVERRTAAERQAAEINDNILAHLVDATHALARPGLASLQIVITETTHNVIVDHADCLHMGIANGCAYKFKALLF